MAKDDKVVIQCHSKKYFTTKSISGNKYKQFLPLGNVI